MSLLEPFSKPRWQHRDPEVRLAAVRELEDEATLLDVLGSEEEPRVLAAALERIHSPATLDSLLAEAPTWLNSDLLQQVRRQRLAPLLAGDGSLPAGANDQLLLQITSLSDDAELLDAAVRAIRDPKLRLQLAGSHPVARARLEAAKGIDDLDVLQVLMQQARHKDKAVYRHCRERIDRELAAQRADEERQEQLERLVADAVALRQAPDSPELRPRFRGLQERWEQLSRHASEAQRDSIDADLGVCAQRIEKMSAELAEVERVAAEADEARQSFAALIEELAALDPQALSDVEQGKVLEANLNHIEERWVAAMRLATPDAEQTETCKASISRWRVALHTTQRLTARQAEAQRLLDAAAHQDGADYRGVLKLQQQFGRLSKALPWPAELVAGTPALLHSLHECQESLGMRLAALEQKAEKTRAKFEQGLETLRGELEANQYRNADRALNRMRNLLRQLPPGQQDRLQEQLKPLQAKLQEIHEWQGFAIAPKKQELVERMRALIGCGDDADTLAAKIKALQEEWKGLGPLAPRQDQALWKAFRGAADDAWAPCKEAFEQRAEARKEIYRQRMALVAQLKDYEKGIAWPDREAPDPELPAPDWKMVRKTLTAARKAFGALGPVDHKQERKSHKALDKVCNRIYAHLEKEYGRNIEQKKALVEQAQSLSAVEDLKQAIDRAKSIQAEWKSVGLTPQNADRPLWKELRKACDAVFARLGEERDQRNAQAKSRNEQRRADEQARKARAAERQQEEQERWQRLLDRMQACALKPDDPDRAAELWGEEGELPKEIDAEALQDWWENGPGKTDEETLREACIALEVLTGIESPPEEKKARMAYQMKRLVEGMGGGPVNQKEQELRALNNLISLRPSSAWISRVGQACRSMKQ